MNVVFPYSALQNIILTGCKFQYDSYDHKAAEAAFRLEMNEEEKKHFIITPINCFNMPDEYKKRFTTKKIGKLRSIDLNPTGMMWRFKIGSKYPKTYFLSDFGVLVKPILYPSEDKDNLIKEGLAVDISMINIKAGNATA